MTSFYPFSYSFVRNDNDGFFAQVEQNKEESDFFVEKRLEEEREHAQREQEEKATRPKAKAPPPKRTQPLRATRFSRDQRDLLQEIFRHEPFPSVTIKLALSLQSGLTRRQINEYVCASSLLCFPTCTCHQHAALYTCSWFVKERHRRRHRRRR